MSGQKFRGVKNLNLKKPEAESDMACSETFPVPTLRQVPEEYALSDHEVDKLIQLYKSQESLYNYKAPDYNDRNKQRQRILYIAREMGKGWTEHVTRTKLKSLRCSYIRQRKNFMIACEEAGVSPGTTQFIPKWKWYKKMDEFLNSFVSFKVGNFVHMASAGPAGNFLVPLSYANVGLQSINGRIKDTEEEREGTAEDLHQIKSENNELNDNLDLECTNEDSNSEQAVDDESSQDSFPGDRSKQSKNFPPSPELSPSPNPSPSGQPRSKRRRTEGKEIQAKSDGDVNDMSTRDSDMLSMLQTTANSLLEFAKSKSSSTNPTMNENFCAFVAKSLDELSQKNQQLARLKIHEVLFKLQTEEDTV